MAIICFRSSAPQTFFPSHRHFVDTPPNPSLLSTKLKHFPFWPLAVGQLLNRELRKRTFRSVPLDDISGVALASRIDFNCSYYLEFPLPDRRVVILQNHNSIRLISAAIWPPCPAPSTITGILVNELSLDDFA